MDERRTPGRIAHPPNAWYLASHCADRPGLMATISLVIEGWSRDHFMETARLAGLQTFERAVTSRAMPTPVLTEDDYQWASWLLCDPTARRLSEFADIPPLQLDGHADGEVLRELSGFLVGLRSSLGLLRSRQYHSRQLQVTRPLTADEEDAACRISTGEVQIRRNWLGVDGSRYALAATGGSRERTAVVVTSTATATDVVDFGNEASARAWLASRVRQTTGPTSTSATGPSCRVAREEELLAWLISHRPNAGMKELAGQVRWTSYLRDELAVAVRLRRDWWVGEPLSAEWPVDVKRQVFAGRMTHLPGAVADSIGWPDARRALAYFDRLASTPVTESQAMRAAEALAVSDAEAAARTAASWGAARVPQAGRLRARPSLPGGWRRPTAAPLPGRAPGAARTPGLLPPPPGAGGTGPVPRMP
jgi:hypothetical protein